MGVEKRSAVERSAASVWRIVNLSSRTFPRDATGRESSPVDTMMLPRVAELGITLGLTAAVVGSNKARPRNEITKPQKGGRRTPWSSSRTTGTTAAATGKQKSTAAA